MKVDIVQEESGYVVYPRAAFKDERYEGEPMFADAAEGTCRDWCDEHGHEYRLHRRVSLVRPNFLRDVEAKCDRLFARMVELANACGWSVVSDVTYRASAAWKDTPTHYCYDGEFGGHARLVKADAADAKQDPETLLRAQKLMDRLYGAAGVLWELGYTLTFDKDGKHTVFGNYPEWVTVDDDE